MSTLHPALENIELPLDIPRFPQWRGDSPGIDAGFSFVMTEFSSIFPGKTDGRTISAGAALCC